MGGGIWFLYAGICLGCKHERCRLCSRVKGFARVAEMGGGDKVPFVQRFARGD